MVNPYESPPVMAEFASQKPKPPPFPWAASFWALASPITGIMASLFTHAALLDTSLHPVGVLIAAGVGMGFFAIWLMAMTQCLRWYWR
jgi:hypothetical protein